MASNSLRKTAIQNMVTRLQTVTPGVTYFRDLSIGTNVSTLVRLAGGEWEGKSFIWVRAGLETLTQEEISPGSTYSSQFEILLDVAVRDNTGETMVSELEDLVHDVYLCLGADRRLSNTVVDTVITRVDPPFYSIEESYAATTIHVVCTFDFEYGTTI